MSFGLSLLSYVNLSIWGEWRSLFCIQIQLRYCKFCPICKNDIGCFWNNVFTLSNNRIVKFYISLIIFLYYSLFTLITTIKNVNMRERSMWVPTHQPAFVSYKRRHIFAQILKIKMDILKFKIEHILRKNCFQKPWCCYVQRWEEIAPMKK